jgi:hypothetical protein
MHNEKLLIHCFQDNLNKATFSWYMRLGNTENWSWKDLVVAFIKQYKYNMDIALDMFSLPLLKKGDKETMHEYA